MSDDALCSRVRELEKERAGRVERHVQQFRLWSGKRMSDTSLLNDELAENRQLKARVAELKQLLGGAIIRLKELGDTSFELPQPSDLVDRCDALACEFYEMQGLGYHVKDGFKFYSGTDPNMDKYWNMAVMAYEHIAGVEVGEDMVHE